MGKISKFIFFTLFIYAIFLRFHQIETNLFFGGEHGQNYLQIKNYIENKELPLVGPPTSHEWLSFGPLFYWIMIPLFLFFNFNPVIPAYFFAIVSLFIAYLNYKLVKNLFSEIVSYVSTSIILISPLWLTWTARSRFYFLTVPLSYLYFYFFLSGLKKNINNLYVAAFILGVMINFHLTALALIPSFVLFIIIFNKKVNVSKTIIYFLIPNIPLITSYFKNGFQPILKFLIWFPYRIGGFLGFVPKNNPTEESLISNMQSPVLIFGNHFLLGSGLLVYLIGTMLVLFTIWLCYGEFRKQKFSNLSIFLASFCVFYLILFIHGNPPDHYYSPIVLIFPIIIGIFFEKLMKNVKFSKLILPLFTLSIVAFSLNYQPPKTSVSYSVQKKVAKKIIDDSNGQEYSLHRVGEFDYYVNDFVDNYQYLLWWMGNEPVKDSKKTYTIYEKKCDFNIETAADSYYVDGILITKEIKDSL